MQIFTVFSVMICIFFEIFSDDPIPTTTLYLPVGIPLLSKIDFVISRNYMCHKKFYKNLLGTIVDKRGTKTGI